MEIKSLKNAERGEKGEERRIVGRIVKILNGPPSGIQVLTNPLLLWKQDLGIWGEVSPVILLHCIGFHLSWLTREICPAGSKEGGKLPRWALPVGATWLGPEGRLPRLRATLADSHRESRKHRHTTRRTEFWQQTEWAWKRTWAPEETTAPADVWWDPEHSTQFCWAQTSNPRKFLLQYLPYDCRHSLMQGPLSDCQPFKGTYCVSFLFFQTSGLKF